MGIDVTLAAGDDTDAWLRCLASSSMATPFHHPDALSVLEAHSDATLHRLLGTNGAEPLGVFPVFEVDGRVATVVQSPPRIVESMSLGPALADLDGMKIRRAERCRTEFVEESLRLVDGMIDPDGIHVRTDTRFDDTRAFRWVELDPTPYHTYEVNLRRSTDDVLAGFSSDARKNVRDADPKRYEVTVGGVADIAFVVEQVRERYAETGGTSRLTVEFVTDLYEAMPEGTVRPYVIAVDGERVAGLVTLWFGDRVYRWQGGVRTDVDLPTSDLLDWHVMCAASEEGMTGYDLVGANMRRLSRYKSKFGPDLRTYYNVRGRNRRLALTTRVRNAARGGYTRISDRFSEQV